MNISKLHRLPRVIREGINYDVKGSIAMVHKFQFREISDGKMSPTIVCV